MKKKAEVLKLPTNRIVQKGQLIYLPETESYIVARCTEDDHSEHTPYEIYFLDDIDDSKPKAGEFVYVGSQAAIYEVIRSSHSGESVAVYKDYLKEDHLQFSFVDDKIKRVVATTMAIHPSNAHRIKRIAKDFLKAYAAAKCDIPSVVLTYEPDAPEGSTHRAMGEFSWLPVCRPDGTVIINKHKKVMYNRSDLIEACYKFKAFHDDIRKNGRTKSTSEFFKENYPE